MKQAHWNRNTTVRAALIAVLGIGVCAQPVLARSHEVNAGFEVAGQSSLGAQKPVDLFLRKDNRGDQFLYVVFADNTLSVLNVSKAAEIRAEKKLVLESPQSGLHVIPMNARFVVATNARSSDGVLAVVDTANVATPEIAQSFRDVDCYTLDPDGHTLYVAQRGQLRILHFDRPITHDAEVWEQFADAP